MRVLSGSFSKLLIMMVFFLSMGSIAQAGPWEHVKTERGVKVYQQQSEGRDLPIFKGESVIEANIYALLAVISDFDRHKEWMHGCHTARLLKRVDELHLLSYNRTDAPWPVDDRDVVLESRVSIQAEKHTVQINFQATRSPLQPEVEGVVRMTRLKGYYRLKALSSTRTHVMYQVDADPAGAIPTWVAEMIVSDMPVNTLNNLREQVGKAKGQYGAFLKRWDPTQNPEAPNVVPD